MYKELVSSIESNLRRFVEVPELTEYKGDIFETNSEISYKIKKNHEEQLIVKVYISWSIYTFEGEWETILARLTELWVNE